MRAGDLASILSTISLSNFSGSLSRSDFDHVTLRLRPKGRIPLPAKILPRRKFLTRVLWAALAVPAALGFAFTITRSEA